MTQETSNADRFAAAGEHTEKEHVLHRRHYRPTCSVVAEECARYLTARRASASPAAAKQAPGDHDDERRRPRRHVLATGWGKLVGLLVEGRPIGEQLAWARAVTVEYPELDRTRRR